MARLLSVIALFPSAAILHAQTNCPTTPIDTSLAVPSITTVDIANSTVSGTIPKGSDGKTLSGTVQICVGGGEQGNPAVIANDGTFKATTITIKSGQQIIAKYLPQPATGSPQTYSLDSPIWLAGACTKDQSSQAALKAPALSIVLGANGAATYSGTVNGASNGSVRICINDLPQANLTASVDTKGAFTGSITFPVKAGDQITAQASTGNPPQYGPMSNSVTIQSGPLQIAGASSSAQNGASMFTMIAGEEQSGYSSLTQNSDAFLSAFIEGPSTNRLFNLSGWGRIRLLSAPQPSTQGIVSVFTDPTGQLTTQDYTKVGEALDFVGGPQFNFKNSTRWSLIGEAGATTPLNSQTVALSYVAPAPGTVECSTLAGRFSVQNGYSPGLQQAPSGASTCLAGGYTDVAFSNQDRSSFLVKYGGGFRTTNPLNENCGNQTNCGLSKGVLDLIVGQDASVTRGLLRHAVVKLDGTVPIPTGSTSYVYVFGSAYVRIAKNIDYSPLILQTASGITIPSPTVIVLPLQQPDRDFFRLGVGISINQVFCKMFSSCTSQASSQPTGSTPNGNSTPKTTNVQSKQ